MRSPLLPKILKLTLIRIFGREQCMLMDKFKKDIEMSGLKCNSEKGF
jgi:hypothetical protein